MGYRIGSFNISKFNLHTNKDSGKDFKQIAHIIKNERFDIIALQEVLTDQAIIRLLKEMGTHWDYRWSVSEGMSTSHREGYAYIWNTNRIKLVAEPKIYDRKGAKYRYVRPPYIARFTPNGKSGGCFMEIRLINTHIAFNKPATVTDMSDAAYRKQEFQTLAEDVYYWFSTRGYGNNMPSYTFMLGDYNLCLVGKGPFIQEFIPINSKRSLRTVQQQRTSLKKPKEEPAFDPGMEDDEANAAEVTEMNIPMTSESFYSHNYDHFSFETTLTERAKITYARVDALEKYYANNLVDFRKEISDHVPIKLKLDLR